MPAPCWSAWFTVASPEPVLGLVPESWKRLDGVGDNVAKESPLTSRHVPPWPLSSPPAGWCRLPMEWPPGLGYGTEHLAS